MQEENKEIFLLAIGACLGMKHLKEAMMLLSRNDAPLGQEWLIML